MKYVYIIGAIVTCVFSAVNCVEAFTGDKKNNREALAWFVATLGWAVVWIAAVSKI